MAHGRLPVFTVAYRLHLRRFYFCRHAVKVQRVITEIQKVRGKMDKRTRGRRIAAVRTETTAFACEQRGHCIHVNAVTAALPFPD